MAYVSNTQKYFFRCVKAFIAVILSMLLLFFTNVLTCFAYNDDYLDITKWRDNPNCYTESIYIESAFGVLSGSLGIATDPYDYALYTFLDITEQSIDDKNNSIAVEFDIVNSDESYVFSVLGNGDIEYLGDYNKCFDIASNYNTYPDTHSGEYITAFDINNGSDSNIVSMYVHINGHRYSVFKDLRLDKPIPVVEDKTTTTKPTTTKKSKPAKTTVAHTTKDKKEKISGASSTKFENSNYHPIASTGSYSNASSNSGNSVANENNSEIVADVPAEDIKAEKNETSKFSKIPKIILIIGIALGLLGLLLMIYSAISDEDKESDNKEDETEEIEKIDEDDFDF